MENNHADDTPGPTPGPVTGLLASLQRLLGSFTEILHTRAEILATETEELGLIIGQLVVYVLASALFFMLGLLLLTAFIIKASPEIYQLYLLAAFGVLYLLVAVVIAQWLKHKLMAWPRLFSTTLSELEKDCNRLGTRS
jgi:uncharacterized membrane protein YqjE